MNLIEQALATATDTRVFLVGQGTLKKIPAVFCKNFPSSTAFLVADGNTWAAAGKRVYDCLRADGVPCAEPLVLPAEPAPYADVETMTRVREALASAGDNARAVAIGAGTINDLCKRASEELHRPYLCVPTAASVDGFASFGAPITDGGFKSTWPCAAPLAIVADTDVLRAAPAAMTASGYADLAAKITGGADWIIADILGFDPIRADVWETTQLPLRGWISDPCCLAEGDSEAMDDLFTGLAMTGFAMQTMHASRPASGAEHMVSHIWEMSHVTRADGTHPSHGEKVGIGTLAITALIERFFAEPFTVADIDAAARAYPTWEEREAMLRSLFGEGVLLDGVLAACKAKHLAPDALQVELAHIVDRWDKLSLRVRRQIIPFATLRDMFRKAGCPTRPEDIGVAARSVPAAIMAAQLIRNRYGILDLAFETGRLPALATELADIWD